MARSTVFKNNQTQAVRLPKAVAFPEGVREVEIVVSGQDRILRPVVRSWADFFDAAPASDDFMAERHDPPPQERDPI
jgi:antitoxin VapB